MTLLKSIAPNIVANVKALTHSDWKSSCDEVIAYRGALLKAQKQCCAYCGRRIVRDEVGHREVDHILPKSQRPTKKFDHAKASSNNRKTRRTTRGYPTFQYVPENLVVACKRCNSYKGSYDGLANRAVAPTTYPSASADFEWVHPHLDVYGLHIARDNGLYTVVNNSLKGAAVIDACGLKKGEEMTQRLIETYVVEAEEMTVTMLSLVLLEDPLHTAKIAKALYKRFKVGSAVIIEDCLKDLQAVKAQGPELLGAAIQDIAVALGTSGPISPP
jgi:5-methylcytosine-specific restriction endonuclease McrA